MATPEGMAAPGEVTLDGDQIAGVRSAGGSTPDRILVPGFIDLQVNGHDDVDAADPEADRDRLDSLLLAQGVTSWCAAVTTRSADDTDRAIRVLEEAKARRGPRPQLVGVHLEGPFLAPSCSRAHPNEHVRPVDVAWLDSLPPIVRLVTIAPEIEGAIAATRSLAARGVVVALGHSEADFATATAAVDAGARLVTHAFNAMGPFRHREPGLIGCALSDDRVVASVIADLVHLHPATLKTVFRAKGVNATALVTDAVAWRSPVHRGQLDCRDGAPRRIDGTLAGSALTMDAAIRNVTRSAGVPLGHALAAASTAPAAALGLDDRGRIAPGARADLVALSRDLTVESVWVGGQLVF